MHFAAWMRETRLSKRLSVSECAERAGVKQPVWTEWERALPSKEWRRRTVEKIACGLGVPLDEALSRAGHAVTEEIGVEIGRQIEPFLMRIRPDRRAAAERMLIDVARSLPDLMTA